MSFDRYKLKNAKDKLDSFMGFCEVISGGKEAFLKSLNSGFPKTKEDGLQYLLLKANK